VKIEIEITELLDIYFIDFVVGVENNHPIHTSIMLRNPVLISRKCNNFREVRNYSPNVLRKLNRENKH
jgi:hypothetical protein